MIDSRLITLRVFASTGTIAETAELTGYSPSAVSSQLRELQKSLGIQLMTRDGRGVRLTSTGRHFVTGLDAIVTEWEGLQASALAAGSQVQTRLGLGGFSTAATSLLAPLARDLRDSHPLVDVRVMEADPARCLELLLAERIDLAVIVSSPAETVIEDKQKFSWTRLLDDPLDVILPSDHRFALRNSVALDELTEEPWITGSPESIYHALFAAAFASVGVVPKVAHEAIEWETMAAFVGAGLGVGLLPRLATLGSVENVTRLRITGDTRPNRKIMAVCRRGSMDSPLIAQSLRILEARAKQIVVQRLEEEHLDPGQLGVAAG